MVETDFQRDLARGLRSQGCYCEKWPDLARAVTKPFDLCMSNNGLFQPIECKLTKRTRKKPMQDEDIAISSACFTGRGHQLPGLLRIYDREQGDPQIGLCGVRIEMRQVVERKAWLFPVWHLRDRDTWAIGDLNENGFTLEWTPSIGWTAPWLPSPDRERLRRGVEGPE